MNSVWISAIGLCGATLIGAVLGSESRNCHINGTTRYLAIVQVSCSRRHSGLRFAQWSPLFRQFEEFGVSNAFSLFGFVAFGTRNPLLRYGIDTRCAKQPPGVRDAFSEALRAQNRLRRYGRDIRYQKRPPLVRK